MQTSNKRWDKKNDPIPHRASQQTRPQQIHRQRTTRDGGTDLQCLQRMDFLPHRGELKNDNRQVLPDLHQNHATVRKRPVCSRTASRNKRRVLPSSIYGKRERKMGSERSKDPDERQFRQQHLLIIFFFYSSFLRINSPNNNTKKNTKQFTIKIT